MSDQEQSPHANAVTGIENMFMQKMGAEAEVSPQDPPAQASEQDVQAEAPEEGQAPEVESEGQDDQSQPEDETEEVEIDGTLWALPKQISKRFVDHSIMTKKTQEAAELRRGLMAEREAVNLERTFERETAQERQQAAIIDAQIAQFKGLDWSSMETQDMLRAQVQVQQLKDAKAEIDKTINQKRTAVQGKLQEAHRQMLQAGANYIRQHIPKFDESMQKEMLEYGTQNGYTPEELGRVVDPRFVIQAWKAMQWDRLQASAPGVTRKAARAAPALRPGASVKTPSAQQIAAKRIKEAKTPKDKRAAGEDYFAGLFSRG